ncbi:peptidoglycan-binding domain-containing protein [Streptomyces phaeochromogenes]|uniref:Tat pathway signal protein n=1 Tax=Streptomyces TaxID=1883 RepID=UPI001CED432A|nr:Tat pathway signal protein [Streptomyces albicerus]
MRLKTIGGRLSATAISFLTLGALAVGTTPASAAWSDGYVRGYDTFVGDWGDEGTLAGFGHSSNAACLWQKILWAEGATEENGSPFDLADVDGHFGRNTDHATKSLQARWGLDDDGLVGNGTFGRADNNLVKESGSTARGETLNLNYNGRLYKLDITRNTQGIYLFKDGSGDWRQAGYDYNTCD